MMIMMMTFEDHYEESESDYKPDKSEGHDSSGSWGNIQAKVTEQLAREE